MGGVAVCGHIHLLGLCYRQMAKRQKEESRKNAALHDGMQALLRTVSYRPTIIIRTGVTALYMAKKNVKRMYDAYHVLGGNDVATELKDKLMKMPEEPAEREE